MFSERNKDFKYDINYLIQKPPQSLVKPINSNKTYSDVV